MLAFAPMGIGEGDDRHNVGMTQHSQRPMMGAVELGAGRAVEASAQVGS